jgi:hypothetical protein
MAVALKPFVPVSLVHRDHSASLLDAFDERFGIALDS